MRKHLRFKHVVPSTKVVNQRTTDEDIAGHATSQLDTTRDLYTGCSQSWDMMRSAAGSHVVKLGIDSSDRVPNDAGNLKL